MDKLVMTMKEFMDKYARDLGFPEYRILEMAQDHLKSGEDFQFVVRNVHVIVPHLSLQEFFKTETKGPGADPVPTAEPEVVKVNPPEFPKTKAQKAGKSEF